MDPEPTLVRRAVFRHLACRRLTVLPPDRITEYAEHPPAMTYCSGCLVSVPTTELVWSGGEPVARPAQVRR